MSARHLSFVETGRSRPSRELRAPPGRAPRRAAARAQLAPARRRLRPRLPRSDRSTTRAWTRCARRSTGSWPGHEPYPAVIVDRRWDLVTANGPALSIFTEGVDAGAAASRRSTCTASACTRRAWPPGCGTSPSTARTSSPSSRATSRSAATPSLAALLDEVRGYPGVSSGASTVLTDPAQLLFLPIASSMPDGTELSLFSTIATFGTALDVTLAELSHRGLLPRRRGHPAGAPAPLTGRP